MNFPFIFRSDLNGSQQCSLVFIMFCTYFIKLIPKYFILFAASVNGIVLGISFSDCSLKCIEYNWFLYIDFETLINYLTRSHRFSMLKIYLLQIKSFTSCFLFCILLISFSLLITLYRTPVQLSWESRHSCLICSLCSKESSQQ